MGRTKQSNYDDLPEGVEVRQWDSGKTTIRITFTYQGKLCRETVKGYDATKQNIKMAANLRAEIGNQITKGTFVYEVYFPKSKRVAFFKRHSRSGTIKIGELLEEYRKEVQHATESSTYVGYRKAINHLLPVFADICIQDLKASTIRSWIQERNVCIKTICNYLIPLRAIVERALEDGLIEKNPFIQIFPKRIVSKERAHTGYEVDPFDQAEVAAILHAATGSFKNLYQFAFFSGLRIEELVALRWEDVDWHRKIVCIRRTKVLSIEQTPKERCKTVSSQREVMLLEPALQALIAQKEHTYLQNEFVFHNPNSNAPWNDHKTYFTAWARCLRLARVQDASGKLQLVRYRPPKNTRHTYASTLLSKGENIFWVSKQLGHADTRITQKCYARWLPDVSVLSGYQPIHNWAEHMKSSSMCAV